LERNFFFVKPDAVLSYTPVQGVRWRMRLGREVAQLNFNDFVSATVFEDDDLRLGNPNLRPDTTWKLELGYERRFGGVSVVKLTGFYHRITDVLDLLPLTPDFEVPGNIGDGRRWGLELEATMPLEWLGLMASKLDITLRWQDSTVVDPVTGEDRVLSGQGGVGAYRSLLAGNNNNKYFVRLNYRQDFEVERVAWGWTLAERDKRPLFKVNELDVHNEGHAIDAFIETTRWFGLKVSIVGENLLNFTQTRDRTVFAGERDFSAVDFHEIRERFNGRRISLSVSGSF